MPPDPLGAALPGQLCGPTTLSQPHPGYAPVTILLQIRCMVLHNCINHAILAEPEVRKCVSLQMVVVEANVKFCIYIHK